MSAPQICVVKANGRKKKICSGSETLSANACMVLPQDYPSTSNSISLGSTLKSFILSIVSGRKSNFRDHIQMYYLFLAFRLGLAGQTSKPYWEKRFKRPLDQFPSTVRPQQFRGSILSAYFLQVCGGRSLAQAATKAVRYPRPMDILRGGNTVSFFADGSF
jgi:hypothetical protein